MVFPTSYKYRRRTEGTSLTGGKGMGLVFAEIELISGEDLVLSRRGMLPENQVRSVTCRSLVDTGALDLVINEEIQKKLDLPVIDRRTIWLADETEREIDMVGPVEVRFENRQTIVKAVVLPGVEEVLLGVIPLEGLDVVIDPVGEKLVGNPKSPNVPTSQVKQISLSI
jgi:clan AA aspartic protease